MRAVWLTDASQPQREEASQSHALAVPLNQGMCGQGLSQGIPTACSGVDTGASSQLHGNVTSFCLFGWSGPALSQWDMATTFLTLVTDPPVPCQGPLPSPSVTISWNQGRGTIHPLPH